MPAHVVSDSRLSSSRQLGRDTTVLVLIHDDDAAASTQLVETGRGRKDPKDGDPRTDKVTKGLPHNPGLACPGSGPTRSQPTAIRPSTPRNCGVGTPRVIRHRWQARSGMKDIVFTESPVVPGGWKIDLQGTRWSRSFSVRQWMSCERVRWHSRGPMSTLLTSVCFLHVREQWCHRQPQTRCPESMCTALVGQAVPEDFPSTEYDRLDLQ